VKRGVCVVVASIVTLFGAYLFGSVATASAASGTLILEPDLNSYQGPGSVSANQDSLTEGPDGVMWTSASESFGNGGQNPGFQRLLGDGAWSFFPASSYTGVTGPLVAGPDGALWFTGGEPVSGAAVVFCTQAWVSRMTTAGAVTTYQLPTQFDQGLGQNAIGCPGGLTVGPDGALWFTLGGLPDAPPEVGRITTSGQMSFFQLPGDQATDLAGPIVVGPGGNLWSIVSYPANLSGYSPSTIDEITTSGQVTEVATIPDGAVDLAAGPDGNIWFADNNNNTIGRLTPAGQVTTYTIPTANSDPTSIIAGPDGALWFSEYGAFKIGRLTTSGQFAEYTVQTMAPYNQLNQILPYQLANGPNGTIWFTTDADFPSIVGYLTPGPGPIAKWTIIDAPVGGKLTRPPVFTHLIGHLPARVVKSHGVIPLKLRFSRGGQVFVTFSRPAPSGLLVYRHEFKVHAGRNRLVLHARRVGLGKNVLGMYPVSGSQSSPKSYERTVKVI
jgi:virginiamycin B lyase